MKNFLTILFAAFIFITPAIAQEKTDDIVVKVNGMVCDFCAQSLEKVFTKEESVNGIDVSLDDQSVTIDTKENQTITDEKIKELIEWGGYDLVSIERSE
jgi:copper chaperone CopZ